MIKASKDIVCVFVDCEWGARHGDLAKRYMVQGFPTVVYTDSEGEEVGRMADRSPAAVARDLEELARDHKTRLR